MALGGSSSLADRTSERERGSDGISACPTDRAVLILDDDRDVAETIRELVEDQGFRAIHASNGREALALLEKVRPCLMLIDVFMPVMNGVEFLRVIRSN